MKLNEQFTNQLRQLYEKGAWFGDTYQEKLQDVTSEQAFRQPHPGVHSIAELVAHVIFWRMPVIKKLKGEKDYVASVDDPANWPPLDTLKAKGWSALLKDFDDSQKQLLKLLANADEKFFESEYSPGNSMAYVTEGIIQHDIYHLGQLGLVKRMLR